jgi:hypothetical protein
MAVEKPRTILEAASSFTGALSDGTSFSAVAGRTRIWSSHPAAKKWPQHFREVTITDAHRTDPHPAIEQATAAPGEKRGA